MTVWGRSCLLSVFLSVCQSVCRTLVSTQTYRWAAALQHPSKFKPTGGHRPFSKHRRSFACVLVLSKCSRTSTRSLGDVASESSVLADGYQFWYSPGLAVLVAFQSQSQKIDRMLADINSSCIVCGEGYFARKECPPLFTCKTTPLPCP